MDLFPSSGEWRETPTLLGPLGRANLSYWSSEVGTSNELNFELEEKASTSVPKM
jgi:hypothetical protein